MQLLDKADRPFSSTGRHQIRNSLSAKLVMRQGSQPAAMSLSLSRQTSFLNFAQLRWQVADRQFRKICLRKVLNYRCSVPDLDQAAILDFIELPLSICLKINNKRTLAFLTAAAQQSWISY